MTTNMNLTSRATAEIWQHIEVSREDSILLRQTATPDKEPNRIKPRLAIYRRRSMRTDTSASMSRQTKEIIERARALGGTWSNRDIYEDDDISAKGGHHRPAIETLLKRMELGHYDGVVVWDFTRWTRNRAENRVISNIMRTHGVELYSVAEPWLHLHGPMGPIVEWAADLAARESEKISARITTWHAQMSDVGAITTKAPFGTKKVPAPSPWPDRKAPIKILAPDEESQADYDGKSRADLVREVFERADQGESLQAIADSWNARGWRDERGKLWRTMRLGTFTVNPRYAGYATRGRDIVHNDGVPLQAYTPVVDPEVWHRLDAARKRREYRSTPSSALRGLLKCGACGTTLSYCGAIDGRRPFYKCVKSMSPSCTRRSRVAAHPAEELVWDTLAHLLNDQDRLAAAQRAPKDAAERERKRAETRLVEVNEAIEALENEYFTGGFKDPAGAGRYTRLKEKLLAEATALAEAATPPAVLPTSFSNAVDAHGSVRAALDSLTVPGRRSLARLLIKEVVVGAGERGKPFDARRCQFIWRTL